MKTYKLGSKVNCIIRSVGVGTIGTQDMTYLNQPYTVLKNVEASLQFKDSNSTSKNAFTLMAFSQDELSEVRLSNVELNDKILNLIFSQQQISLASTMQNCESENGKIYITSSADEISQVFIYDVDGQLEAMYPTLNTKEVSVQRDSNYLVFFSYKTDKSFSLNRKQSMYLTLDLIVEGNLEDQLTTATIHIDKCALSVDKNLYFNRSVNAVDLKFTVISGKENYITL